MASILCVWTLCLETLRAFFLLVTLLLREFTTRNFGLQSLVGQLEFGSAVPHAKFKFSWVGWFPLATATVGSHERSEDYAEKHFRGRSPVRQRYRTDTKPEEIGGPVRERFFAFLEIGFAVSKKQGIRAKSGGRCRGALHGKRR